MSASLVGSEMCIRDSANARGAAAQAFCGPRRQAPPWQAPPVVCCWRLYAVSYTHLTLPTICSV
eukprot:3846294-Alexandrium_andersonii.AAC.1